MGEHQEQSRAGERQAGGKGAAWKARARQRLRAPFGVVPHNQADYSGNQRPVGRFVALAEEELAFGRAFLFVPLFLALGAAWWFARPSAPPFWGLCLYWAVAFLSWVLLRHARPAQGLAAALAAAFLTGALFAQLEVLRLSTVMLDSPVTTHVTGIVEAREPTGSGWRYVLRVIATEDPAIRRPPERVTLVGRGNLPPVEIGGALTGTARLSPPSGPALPGLVDFGFLSYFDGIGAVGFFYGAPEALPAPLALRRDGLLEAAGNAAGRWIERLRDTIAGNIRAVLPGESGAFANAIITGERRALGDDTLTALRNAGLAHVIAISGLHMALAAGIFFSALRLILAFSPWAAEAVATKKLAALAAILAAAFYLAISGMQVSARRAFIMLAIMLGAAIVDRPAISLRNVALAGLVILAVSPSEAVGPGMQMSFAATLALIAGYGIWRRRHAGERGFRPRTVARMLLLAASGIALTALIGGLSTAPIAMAHFQRVAGYGLLGNLLAMPIVTFLVMPAGLLAMLTMPLGLQTPFLLAMGLGLDWVIAIAKWVDGLGGAFETGATPPGFLLLFLLGFMLLVLLRTRLRLTGLLPMALAFILLAMPRSDDRPALLISEDGLLLALVTGKAAALSKSRPPAFIYDQWQSAYGIRTARPPAEGEGGAAFFDGSDRFAPLEREQMEAARAALAADIASAGARPGQFICEKEAWCVAVFGAGPDHSGRVGVAQIFRPALTGAACDTADIVVSVYRPGFEACRSGSFLVTPAMRRQTGALRLTPDAPAQRESPASQKEGPSAMAAISQEIPTRGAWLPGDQPYLSEDEPARGAGQGVAARSSTTLDADSPPPGAQQNPAPGLPGDARPAASGAVKEGSPVLADGASRAAAADAPVNGTGDRGAGLNCHTARLTVTPAITSVTRAWNRHRLYDWRSGAYVAPIALPQKIEFISGSDGSARQACPEP